MENSIKKFNEILNKTTYNRFKKWNKYRGLVSKFIDNHFSNRDNKSLIIYGAGNLDDIDLNILGKKFSKITLSDIDESAMKNALEKYQNLSHKLETKYSEYTGLESDNLWNDFVKNIFVSRSKNQIDEIFDQYNQTVKNHKWNLSNSYDALIVCPIYTQLLLQQGLEYLSALEKLHYPTNNLEYVKEHILDLVASVIEKFNTNVLATANSNAIIAIMSDIFETEKGSEFFKEAHQVYNDNTKMDIFQEKYLKQYGPGVGDFGMHDFSNSVSEIVSKWFEWEFDDNRIIYVKILIAKKPH